MSGRRSLPKSLSIHPSTPKEIAQKVYNDEEVSKFFSGSISSRVGQGSASKKLHLEAIDHDAPAVDLFPLEYILYFRPSIKTVKTIHKAYPNATRSTDAAGWNVLHRAIYYRCCEEVVFFLITQCPPDFPIMPAAGSHNTPLHLACRSIYPSFILVALIQKGLSANKICGETQPKSPLGQCTNSGFTALHVVIITPALSRNDKIERIQLLVQADPGLLLAGTGDATQPQMLARSVQDRDKSIYRPLDRMVKLAKLGDMKYSTRHELDAAIQECNQHLLNAKTSGATNTMTATTASLTASTTTGSGGSKTFMDQFALCHSVVALHIAEKLDSQREKVKSLEEMDRLINEYSALLDEAIENKQWNIAKAQQELIEKLETQKAIEYDVSGQSHVEEASHQVLNGLLYNGPWKARKLPLQYISKSTNAFDPSRHLGSGGFGTVYRGVDPSRGTTFAVKKIKGDVVASPFVYERVKPKLFAEIQVSPCCISILLQETSNAYS